MRSTRHIQHVYYLITSLFWFATALPLPLIVLLGLARGLDLAQVGLLMGSYALTVALLELPTGGLADAIGRKRVSILAYGCGAAATVIMLFAFSFPVFLAASVLNGIARALSSGALDAWFVDSLQAADPEIDLQPVLAKAGIFTLLSLGLGTGLGGLIPLRFDHLPPDGTTVFTPLSMPMLFAFAAQLLLIALTVLLVREDLTLARAGDWRQGFSKVPAMVRTGIALTRRNSTILLLMGASMAGGLAMISLESFWQPNFARLLGGSQGHTPVFGLVLGGSFLVGAAGNALATPLSRLLGRRYGLVCAVFQGAWGASVVLLALQTELPLAVLFFWLAYMSMGGVNSPHNTLLNREIPAEQRSSMLSIASLATYAGAGLGAGGLGYLAEHVSISSAWIVSGVVLMISLGLYLRIDARRTRSGLLPEGSAAEV